MKIRAVEKITGYEVQRVNVDTKGVHLRAVLGQVQIASVCGVNESAACKALVAAVYAVHSEEVRKEQGYRCSACGLMRPLQVHHRVKRSAGRSDVRSNLEALCRSCHAIKHGEKRRAT